MPHSRVKEEASPVEHLAEDWRVFQQVESGALDYAWRIWEVYAPAVVLGRFGRAAEEVFVADCERDGVPVLRRCSGGSAVVIGVGCLNFAVVLSLGSHPTLLDVERSFGVVLRRIAAALAIEGLVIAGGTDLAIDGRKISGNAQRRGRRAILHHGTLLLRDFDPMLATRYLREPRRQPEYRAGRPHHDFVGSLPMARDLAAARLSEALEDLGFVAATVGFRR